MLMFFLLTEGFLDFGRQPGKNIIIGRGIIMCTLLLIHQRDVDKRHQRYCMITLAPFICLCISIVALRDELGCATIEFLIIAIDHDFYFLVVDMQPDM